MSDGELEACTIVNVDGEDLLIRGSSEMNDLDRAMFAEVVRAAKAKYARDTGSDDGG